MTWYAYMKGAKWLGVPPWGDATKGLSQVSKCWSNWAIIAAQVEEEQHQNQLASIFR